MCRFYYNKVYFAVINSNSRPLEHAKKFGSETNEERECIRFSKLVKKAKYLAQDGKVPEELELNRQALQIHYHEKLAKRIAKMEVIMRKKCFLLSFELKNLAGLFF